jgi:prepilin-type N-terminal cleavage/methylation domain-containing protein
VKAARRPSAFTLIELLVVIAILGIIAGLAVPALKNLGKANVQTSASRQLLDDIGRARQLAISDHTTVFMVFVPTNFCYLSSGGLNTTWYNNLTAAQLAIVTNLLSMQMSGYTFVAYGALGDQPGQHQWHYLAPWQSLPQNFIIAPWKFAPAPSTTLTYFKDSINGNPFTITNFDYTNGIPFPTADSNLVYAASQAQMPSLPYIAFNYLGQLVSSAIDQDVAGNGADIPLAQGSVAYALNPSTKTPTLNPLGANAVAESPLGNSTNITYNIVHIDALTGRATLEYHQVQ